MPKATSSQPRRPLLQGTIWDRSLLEEVPQRWRALYTVVLPLKYLLFLGFGIAGISTRIPAISEFVSVGYGDVWTVLVGLTGALALVGISARRPLLELYAAIVLEVLLLSYVCSLLALAAAGDLDRLAMAVGFPIVLGLPAWRIVDIIRTERRRG